MINRKFPKRSKQARHTSMISRNKTRLLFLAFFALVGSALLFATFANTNPTSLEYPRPNTTGFTRLNIPDNGIVNKLDINTDYELIMPNKPIPVLDLKGGRNIVIVGGEVRVNKPFLHRSDNGRVNRAMQLQAWSGHLYVEGVEISGDWIFEGINANSTAAEFPNAKITMQKIRVSDPIYATRGPNGAHWGGDVYQSWQQPSKGTYLADWTITGLTYQGFFIQNNGNGATQTNIELKRIEARHLSTFPTAVMRRDGVDTSLFYNPGTFKFWAASGVNKFTLQDVYLTQNTTGESRSWETQLSQRTSGAVQAVGSVKKGSPPSEFVPDGSVGLGYRSGSVAPPTTTPPVPPATQAQCDFNGDGRVTLIDLSVLLSNYGKDVTSNRTGDCTGDGRVGLADLSKLLSNYGR